MKKFKFQKGGINFPFSTYTSQEDLKGGPRNTNYNIPESYENKPLHLRSIDEELYNNSPNYKATTKDAYEVQKGIKEGLIQVIPNQDGTFRYVNTGEVVPDDTHEMLFSAGKGALKAGIKGANIAKGAFDGLGEYYLPRDFLQATGFTVQAIDKALEGDNPMKDGLMAALRFAQSNTPGLGGKYNPIIAALMKLPAKALAQFPNLNRLLRGSGLYYSMDKESPDSGGKRLDRPAYSKLSNRIKESIENKSMQNNSKSFSELNKEYNNNELKNTGQFFFKKGGKLDKNKMKCNSPKSTPNHPTKSHVVKACENGKEKIIRFGQQGVKGSPDGSKRNKAFKARHASNIKKGKMSAAYWANRVKW